MLQPDWLYGVSSQAPRKSQQAAKDLAGSLEAEGDCKLAKSAPEMALLSILPPGKAFLRVTTKQQVRLILSRPAWCWEALPLLAPMSSLKKQQITDLAFSGFPDPDHFFLIVRAGSSNNNHLTAKLRLTVHGLVPRLSEFFSSTQISPELFHFRSL